MASAAMTMATSSSNATEPSSNDDHNSEIPDLHDENGDFCSAGESSRSPGEVYSFARHHQQQEEEEDARRGYGFNDSPVDGDGSGKKNRRKKSKPMRIPSNTSSGAVDMTPGKQQGDEIGEEDDELEAGQLSLTFSRPSSAGSVDEDEDAPLDLCSSGGEHQRNSNKGRIRVVANLMPEFDKEEDGGEEPGSVAEWHAKLQESLPSFLANAKGESSTITFICT
jgi:hypothetical protein